MIDMAGINIVWNPVNLTPPEVVAENVRIAKSRSAKYGYPKKATQPRLAIVAGGPSIKNRLKDIRKYPDRWICASTMPWAVMMGLKGTYFNIDPSPDCVVETRGVEKAILATTVHPKVFDALEGKDIGVFDLRASDKDQNHGVTTATAVPELAILLGYKEVCFFGCESSFKESTHAYRNDLETNKNQIWVECGERTYQTRPDYFLQALYIAEHIRVFPWMFKEKSGGLLWALVKFGTYKIVALADILNPVLKAA